MHLYEVLRRPVITEKNTILMDQHKYVFEVRKDANKAQVKMAVEKAFSVNVKAVNMITVPAKPKGFGRMKGHKSSWKKQLLRLNRETRLKSLKGSKLR